MEILKPRKLSFGKVMLITIFVTLFFLLGGYLHYYTFLSSIPYDVNGIHVWQSLWDILWASLAFVFIKYYNNELEFPVNEMFNFKNINFKIILIVIFVIALLQPIGSLILYKKVSISNDFNLFASIINFFIVGLTEEIVFRGWAMNALSKVTSTRKANIIQSIFFMLAHLLPWCVMLLVGGNISNIPVLYLCLQLPMTFVTGCIFGRIMNKTHSLWTPIIIHCLWDVTADLFGMM